LSLTHTAKTLHLAFCEKPLLDNNFTKAWPDIAFTQGFKAQKRRALHQSLSKIKPATPAEQVQKANET